jgi:hypothetical protein
MNARYTVTYHPDVDQVDQRYILGLHGTVGRRAMEECGWLVDFCADKDGLSTLGIDGADEKTFAALNHGVFAGFFRSRAVLYVAQFGRAIYVLLVRPCSPKYLSEIREEALNRASRYERVRERR